MVTCRRLCVPDSHSLCFLISRGPPSATLFPYTTLFRSTQAPPRRTDAIMRLVPPVAGGLVAALGALAWWNQQEEAGPGVDRGPEPKAERDDEGGPSA